MSSTSEIAEAIIKTYLNEVDTFLLHARSRDKLDALFQRLQTIEPQSKLIRLPLLDLVLPQYSSDNFQTQYANWFDEVVQDYGLPTHMIIAGGGVSANDLYTLQLNLISPMLCVQEYIRKVRDVLHHPKYNNRTFQILYLSSVMSDIRTSTYGRAKWMMEKYLDSINERQILTQYAKIGPVDTQLLRSSREKLVMERKDGVFRQLVTKVMVCMIDWLCVPADEVATAIRTRTDQLRHDFYAPNFMGYFSILAAPIFWIIRRFA